MGPPLRDGAVSRAAGGNPRGGAPKEKGAGQVVLDASAVLAVLHGEAGAEEVERRLEDAGAGAFMGAVNLSEVVAKLAERGVPGDEIREAIGSLALNIAAFDEETAYLAGMLRAETRERGLSLGDRACVALGRRVDAPVLTMERAWEGLGGVEVIARKPTNARGNGEQ